MNFENIPYEIHQSLDCIFKGCKLRLKILLIIYDFPGITDRDVITIAKLAGKVGKGMIKYFIDSGIVIAKEAGISTNLWINEENPKVVDLVKYMKENGYYCSL